MNSYLNAATAALHAALEAPDKTTKSRCVEQARLYVDYAVARGAGHPVTVAQDEIHYARACASPEDVKDHYYRNAIRFISEALGQEVSS